MRLQQWSSLEPLMEEKFWCLIGPQWATPFKQHNYMGTDMVEPVPYLEVKKGREKDKMKEWSQKDHIHQH